MNKVWLATLGSILLLLTAIPGCRDNTPTLTPPKEPPFKMIFKYYSPGKNILDTFNGTFTKDLTNEPSITTNLVLTDQEKSSIYQKMIEMDFFSYPDKFWAPYGSLSDNSSTPINLVFQYYFYIEYDSQVKELSWIDHIPIPFFESDMKIAGNITRAPSIPYPEGSALMKEILRSYRENNLYWLKNQDEKAFKLRELIKLIRDIIESKEEYKKLPEAKQPLLI
jgi:hypothetical protein